MAFDAIPSELRERAQWVLWRNVMKSGRPTKVPYQATAPAIEARSNDPDTWSTFDEAVTAVGEGGVDGLGFVFTKSDPFIGVDLDVKGKALAGWQTDIIEALGSYAEFSPSKVGAHVIVNGQLDRAHKKVGLEIYPCGRYFTFTGDQIPDTPGDIREANGALTGIIAEHFGAANGQLPADLEGDKWGPGERNDKLTSVGGRMRRDGLSSHAIHAALQVVNKERCDPPLGKPEVLDIARSVGRYAPAEEEPEIAWGKGPPPALSRTIDAPSVLRTTTAAELEHQDFGPVRWIQRPFLPQGVALLAGKPKMGKSWFALQIGTATASDRAALKIDPQLAGYGVPGGNVLYMALEDNDRRMQTRIKKQGNGFPERFEYVTSAPRGDEVVGAIRAWLARVPNPRLVIIDTLQKIRPERRNSNIYENDYADGGALKPLADEHDVAILLVHHMRKGTSEDPVESVSGTLGLVGSVDTVLVMKRERGAADAFLYVTGRDIEGDDEMALQWKEASGTWAYMGSAAKHRVTSDQADVVEALRDAGEPMTVRELAREVGKSYEAVRKMVKRMEADDTLTRVSGNAKTGHKYSLS